MKIWDTIIVGAGPGGCAAAFDLARAGRKVLLLDRASFPRQKACAGGLTLKAVEALRYPIDPVGRERVDHIRVEKSGGQSVTLRRRDPYCFMTVRKELDDYCLRQTLAAGATFERIGAITAIEQEADAVSATVDGEKHRARFLIGADGVHSQVRKLTDRLSHWFWRAFALEATVVVPDGRREDLVFDFAPVREGYGWVFPKGDHVNVGLFSSATEEKIDRGRLAEYINTRFGNVTADEVIGQYAGFGAPQHQVPAGRVFLVGDAGGFVDPLTGEGIYFAVISGQAAAEAIDADLKSQATAHQRFAQTTAKVRADLATTTSAARWFYGNLDQGYRILSLRLLQSTVLNAFAKGFNPARLAARVRRLIPRAS